MAEFLPDHEMDDQIQSNWLNLDKNGTYRFRMMGVQGDDQMFIEGWEAWEEVVNPDGETKRIPHRRKYVRGEKAPKELVDIDRSGNPKYFWMFVVIHEDVPKILEIRQKTIRGAILEYCRDEDYGDPRGYDITITRSGHKMDTKYIVTPKPPSPATQEMLDAVADAKINLQAIWEGGQPFGALEGAVNDQENMARLNKEDDTADPNAVLTRIMNKHQNQ